MYNRSQNPQVQYSLTKLTEALFYHLQTKPLRSVTISQICSHAGITRRTFYRNCVQKEDLILYACDRLIEEMRAGADFTDTDARAMFRYFFSFWNDHHGFLRCVYDSDSFELFERRIFDICNVHARLSLRDDPLRDHPRAKNLERFSNVFLLGGLTRMLYAWAEESFLSTVDELVDTIPSLFPHERWDQPLTVKTADVQ